MLEQKAPVVALVLEEQTGAVYVNDWEKMVQRNALRANLLGEILWGVFSVGSAHGGSGPILGKASYNLPPKVQHGSTKLRVG